MKALQFIFVLMLLSRTVLAAEDLVSLPSPHSPEHTLNRLESAVSARGLNVFARIDHGAGAASVGQALRPTLLLIFGHPRGGTPLMQCSQTLGIDLPLKMLVWQDEAGQVWLSYTPPATVAARQDARDCPAVENLDAMMSALARETVTP